MTARPWPEERNSRAIRLAQLGWTAQQIASDLEISRNAVMGKLRRLGVPLSRARGPRRHTKLPIPARTPILRKRVKPMQPQPPVLAPPSPTRFADIGEFQCRRFLGGDDHLPVFDRLYCGAPVEPGATFRFCAACSRWLTVTKGMAEA